MVVSEGYVADAPNVVVGMSLVVDLAIFVVVDIVVRSAKNN